MSVETEPFRLKYALSTIYKMSAVEQSFFTHTCTEKTNNTAFS